MEWLRIKRVRLLAACPPCSATTIFPPLLSSLLLSSAVLPSLRSNFTTSSTSCRPHNRHSFPLILLLPFPSSPSPLSLPPPLLSARSSPPPARPAARTAGAPAHYGTAARHRHTHTQLSTRAHTHTDRASRRRYARVTPRPPGPPGPYSGPPGPYSGPPGPYSGTPGPYSGPLGPYSRRSNHSSRLRPGAASGRRNTVRRGSGCAAWTALQPMRSAPMAVEGVRVACDCDAGSAASPCAPSPKGSAPSPRGCALQPMRPAPMAGQGARIACVEARRRAT
jgi:hypothetical protein